MKLSQFETRRRLAQAHGKWSFTLAGKRKHLAALLSIMLAGTAHAVDGFQAVRIEDKDRPVLDGRLDDAVWNSVPVYQDFFQTQPVDKVAAPFRTSVRLVYDSHYLYVGLEAEDPAPGEIRAPFTLRDGITDDQDILGIYLDTAGSSKNARYFLTNARGAITDGSITNENGEDKAPDYDFDVASVRTARGWSAEFRIPFSTLRYQADSPAQWRLLVYRNMLRDQRYRMYSAPVTLDTKCILCFGKPVDGLRDLPNGVNWSATPQFVFGKGNTRVDGQPQERYTSNSAGLDIKVLPDASSTVDITINPDFSQVELDTPVLRGNSAYSIFVPEKRPFFLEGADIFQSPFQVINTRTITDPSWGLRYTRRDSTLDMTVLTAKDQGGGLVQLPGPYATNYSNQDFSSQATLARLNYNFGNFTAGALLTDRTLADGRGYNRVAGADFSWQPRDNERWRFQVLGSATSALQDENGQLQRADPQSGYAAKIDWTMDSATWGGVFSTEMVSEHFRADNGFIPQSGYKELGAALTRRWGKWGFWNETKTYLYVDHKQDWQGRLIADDVYPAVWLAGPYDAQLEVRFKPSNQQRLDPGGERFSLRQIFAIFSISPGPKVGQIYTELELGDELDVESGRKGKGGKLYTYARLNPVERLEITPTYSINWIDGIEGPANGQRLYSEYAAQITTMLHLSERDTLRLILQKTSVRRNSDFYQVPVIPETRSKTLSLVYKHAYSAASNLFAGVTLQDGVSPGHDPRRRQNEAFLKFAWQYN